MKAFFSAVLFSTLFALVNSQIVFPVPTIPTTLSLCCKIPENVKGILSNFTCFGSSKSGAQTLRKEDDKIVSWKPPEVFFSPPEATFVRLQYKPGSGCDSVFGQIHTLTLANNATVGRGFSSTGYFIVDTDYYHPNEYCVERFDLSSAQVRVCPPKCERGIATPKSAAIRKSTACINKCCEMGKRMSFDMVTNRAVCVKSDVRFQPPLYSKNLKRLSAFEQSKIDLHFQRSRINCPQGAAKQISPLDPAQAEKIRHKSLCFRVLSDGTLKYRNPRRNWVEFPIHEGNSYGYCIDAVEQFRDASASHAVSQEFELAVAVCSIPDQDEAELAQQKTNRIIYGTLMISSSVFLLLTFIVYALLFNQHGLHGWTTMGHSATMFFMYIFVGIAHLVPLGDSEGQWHGTPTCVLIAVLAHFFYISTFCWLTLICFDLWYTFSSVSVKSSKGKKRFGFYLAFGWVAPGIFVLSSFIIDQYHDASTCTQLITAGYGKANCYIFVESLGEFVFYPIAVLLGLNMIFFGVTTYKLHVYKESTRIATNNLENNQQFFQLFSKLFIVMGMTWILEVVSWLHIGAETRWYWMIFDIINVLQALLIFIIYVCKKKTLLALHKNYHCFKVVLGPLLRLFNCTPPHPDQSSSSIGSTSRKYPQRLGRKGANQSLITSSVRVSNMSTTDTSI